MSRQRRSGGGGPASEGGKQGSAPSSGSSSAVTGPDNSLSGAICAEQEGLGPAEREALAGLEAEFGMGLGVGDLEAAIDGAESDLPPMLAAAAAQETAAVADQITADVGAAEDLRDRAAAAVAHVEGCEVSGADEKLLSSVDREAAELDAAVSASRTALREAYKLSPESRPLVGAGGGSLVPELEAGGDWLEEMAREADLLWGGFYNGVYGTETSEDAGRRLGEVIAAYPDAMHYFFRVVMQRLPEDRRDLALLEAALDTCGLSTADFPADVSGWLGAVYAEDFGGDGVADWARAAAHMTEMSDTIGEVGGPGSRNPFGARKQLPTDVKVAEHLEPLAALMRVYNHMADHFAALDTIRASAEGAAGDAVYAQLYDGLVLADAEWAAQRTIIQQMGTFPGTEAQLAALGGRPDRGLGLALDEGVGNLLEAREADTLIELRARGVIASESVGDLGSDELMQQAVEAAAMVKKMADQADTSVFDVARSGVKSAQVPGVASILAFEQAARKLTSASDITKAAADTQVLPAGRVVNTAEAAHKLIDACAGAAQQLMDAGSVALSHYADARLDAANTLDDVGARELAKLEGVQAASRANQLSRVGAQLGAIGAVGDFIGGAKAAMVLLDPSASENDRRGARFDLASAGVGIGSTLASAAGVAGAATAGTAAGLGIAWVKMISDELAHIEAVETAARSSVRSEAWGLVRRQANTALQATARAAASSQLFRSAGDAVEGTAAKGYERYAEHVADALKQQTWLVDWIRELPDRFDAPSSLIVTPDAIGWEGDAEQAVQAFEDNAGDGLVALREASSGGQSTEDIDAKLGWAGLDVFRGVRAAADVFFDQSKRDAQG